LLFTISDLCRKVAEIHLTGQLSTAFQDCCCCK